VCLVTECGYDRFQLDLNSCGLNPGAIRGS
jgi:hypothetical protein